VFLFFQAQYSSDLHRFLMGAADAFISLSQAESSLGYRKRRAVTK